MVEPIDPRGIKPLPPVRPLKPGARPADRRRRREEEAEKDAGVERPPRDRRRGRHIDEHC